MIEKPNIVILDGYTLNSGDLSWEPLAALGNLTVYDRTAPDEVVPRSLNAEIVLTNKTVVTGEHIRLMPKTKYIGVMATGINVVDVAAAVECGIVVTNVPAYSTDSVAQQIFSIILTITNHSEYHAQQNRMGRWTASPDFAYSDFPLIELAGKRLGIVGYGNIGHATARIARAFGMKVAVFSSKSQAELPDVEKMSLEELFAESDVVCMCCPLTADNRGMINSSLLDRMKPTAIFINTARGGLVNEADLAAALDNNRLYAAGLDVLNQEPPVNGSPLLSARNCYITPHVAWATFEARERCLDITIANVKGYLAGEPCNVVS